jgi:hypothetical protein
MVDAPEPLPAPRGRLQVFGSDRSKLAPWAAAVLGAAALTLAAWLRLPGLTRDTLWAEDGGVFLRQALGSGLLTGILDPYDGYLHLLPRVLAHLSLRTGPLDAYAERITWLSCGCVGLVGIAVFFLSRPYVPSTGSRVLLAAIPALLPIGPLEVLGNTANLHWYMLWLMPWILIYPTRRLLPNFLLAGLAFVAATTEIQTVLFAPLIWVAVHTRRQWGGSVGLLLGLAMQFITFVSFPRSVSKDAVPWDLGSVIIGWLLQGGVSSVESSASSAGAAWTYFGGALLVVPIALLLTPIVTAAVKGRATLLAVVAFVGVSAALWFAAQVFNNRTFMNYSSFTNEEWLKFDFLRYAAAPAMFGLGALALAIGGFQWGHEARGPSGEVPCSRLVLRWETICATVIGTILVFGFFPPTSSRAAGPSWQAQVSVGRSACAADPLLAEVPALVAPRGWEFERVAISCNRLRIHNNESR